MARTTTLAAACSLVGLAACDVRPSSTDLNPEGPPMVRQVFVSEKVTTAGGSTRIRTGLAFGIHDDVIFEDDDRVVNTAVARGAQQIRVIVDELLRGDAPCDPNNADDTNRCWALEEIACFDGSFSRVPLDATPDDVAACSGAQEDLGDCENICVTAGGKVGILDANLDGAADTRQMIDYSGTGAGELAVNVECDGVVMPLDPVASFYNPSGNQLIPAGNIGLNGLGPAIVLVPRDGLKTSAECTITFHPEVTDKDGIQVCAPTDGDVNQDCAPGDTSKIGFLVEPLTLKGSEPADGATDVDFSSVPAPMILQFIAALDPATLDGISLADGVGTVIPIVVVADPDDPSIVNIEVTAGFTAATEYTVTIPTTVTDIFGGALPEDITITFTTAAAI